MLAQKMKKDDRYQAILENMPEGFSYLKIIFDENDKPVDFEFLEVNCAFEKITGVKRNLVIGKRLTEVFKGQLSYDIDWVKTCSEIATSGGSIKFNFYSRSLKIWLLISIYSFEYGYFSIFFENISWLKMTQIKLQEIFDSSPDSIVVTDLNGIILDCNQKALDIHKSASKSEFIGRNARGLAAPEYTQRLRKCMEEARTVGSIKEAELMLKNSLGQTYWVEISVNLMRDESEQPSGYIAMARDITKRKKMEAELRKLTSEYEMIFNCTQDAIFLVNVGKNGIFRYSRLNASHEKATGLVSKLVEGLTPRELLGDELGEQLENNYRRCVVEKRVIEYEETLPLPAGKKTWHTMLSPVMKDDEVVFIVGSSRDISEERRIIENLKHTSFHDSLTGVYNRTFFEEQLHNVDTEGQLPLSLIIGDVNGLKLANDAFGHKEGDRLLKKVAEILRSSCSENDIIARMDGDEFAIIMPRTNEREATKISNRIKELSATGVPDPILPSIAMGLATKTDSSQTMDDIFKQTEDRMYKNKLSEGKSVRSSVINSLIKTLEERTHETEEHAQRMKALAVNLGRMLGISNTGLDELSLLAVLHDIGKIAIPDGILTKTGCLTREEWVIMRKHCEIGYRIAVSSPELVSIANGILCHHEHWDGKGYPQGLKGEEIPVTSRIINIVDAFDAMTNDRSYHKAVTKAEAVKELKRCSGTQFDPDIVKAFIDMISKNE